jgi:long-chain acyl-CoA synthetase
LSFASSLQDFTGRTALILPDGSRQSYKELANLSDSIYSMAGAPIPRRSLVAIECDNSLSSLAGYLGALRNDFPLLLVDAQLSQELRERLYSHFNVPWVWGESSQWKHRPCKSPQVHKDLAVLLSTSGSTGEPKLVKLTQSNLQSNAASIARYLEIDFDERPITSLPIHYSYGLSVINSHLLKGATLLLTSEPITSKQFWNFFRDYKASSFAGVPTTYTMLRKLRFERMSLPTLRVMTQAGGPLDPELIRWFDELARSRGQRFFVMYGQTEATARISYVPPERLFEKIGSIGIPIPDGTIELIDEEASLITEAGTIGQLRYSGPNVMMGYAENETDLAANDSQGGCLLTGDLAKRDTDGYFYLCGRLKRFIKIFGNRFSLDEVELQLRARGFDVAVTGHDDLLIIAIRGEKLGIDALKTNVPLWYRIHHSAIDVVAVENFPMSSSGKILYTELFKKLTL